MASATVPARVRLPARPADVPDRRTVVLVVGRGIAAVLDLLADAHDGDLDVTIERLLRRGLAIDVETKEATCST